MEDAQESVKMWRKKAIEVECFHMETEIQNQMNHSLYPLEDCADSKESLKIPGSLRQNTPNKDIMLSMSDDRIQVCT